MSMQPNRRLLDQYREAKSGRRLDHQQQQSGQGAAVMAADYPAGTSQFSSVVTGHRMEIFGIQAVDADAIASMFNP